MGLEQVKLEIIKNANSEAKVITDEAKKEAAKITESGKAEMESCKKETERALKDLVQVMKSKELAQSALESRKNLYEHKKQIINNAFESAMKKIISFNEQERREVLESLFSNAKNEIDVGIIYCNKKDKDFFKDKDVEIKEAETSGGLIAENKDGSIRIDFSYETMLENIREESLQEVSKLLFK